MEKLQLALAGAWHVHCGRYLPQVNSLFADKVEWKYVWDEDDARAEHWCRELGAKRADSYQQILDDPEVGAVICEAETSKHRDIIIRAAEAGKPVYTDKILTISSADAVAIKAALDKSGVKFAVSHEALPIDAYIYTKKLADEGKLGKPVALYFRRAHSGAKGQLADAWFSKEIAGGGALIDLGIHGVSVLAHFGGEPCKVSAVLHNFTGHETEDSATIMVQFKDGAIGTAHTDMVTNMQENNFEYIGTDGVVTVTGREGQTSMRLNSAHMEGFEKFMNPVSLETYQAETLFPISLFVRFVLDESDKRQYMDCFDIDTGVKVVRLVECAYESALIGKPVSYAF